MQHSWTRDIDWAGDHIGERPGRPTSNAGAFRSPKPSPMAAHLSSVEIEEQILQSPDLQHHHAAVILYLRLDIWLLESIFALRNSESAELARLHPSLFDSPPEPLFHLIYTLRHFLGLDLSSTIEKIESLQPNERGKERLREPGSSSRVAPRGQAYGCPSKYCKKAFVKSGHAVNHVEKQHPEYLKLHPDYQPSHFMVEHHRSCPTSPELERQERPRPSNRPHELRPSKALSRTHSATAASENLAIYWNDDSGAGWDRPSPQLQGYDSQGDSDEASQLFPVGQFNRTVSYPSPSYSGTAQEASEQMNTCTSRYYAPVNQSKRAREHSSSSGSVGTIRDMDDGNTTRFRHHHAKRRSAYGI